MEPRSPLLLLSPRLFPSPLIEPSRSSASSPASRCRIGLRPSLRCHADLRYALPSLFLPPLTSSHRQIARLRLSLPLCRSGDLLLLFSRIAAAFLPLLLLLRSAVSVSWDRPFASSSSLTSCCYRRRRLSGLAALPAGRAEVRQAGASVAAVTAQLMGGRLDPLRDTPAQALAFTVDRSGDEAPLPWIGPAHFC